MGRSERRIALANTNERLYWRNKEGLYIMSKEVGVYEDEGSSETEKNGDHVDASDFEVEDCGQGAGAKQFEQMGGRSTI
jgi:hypothetical protein